jgi:hypothetical protein
MTIYYINSISYRINIFSEELILNELVNVLSLLNISFFKAKSLEMYQVGTIL